MLNAVGAAASQRPVRIRAQKKKSLAGAWPGRRQATPEGQIALPLALPLAERQQFQQMF